MFGHEPNRIIWSKLKELHDAKMSVDLIVLQSSLSEEDLAAIGGSSSLASLIANLPSKPAITTYYRVVEEAYARRSYKALGERLANEAESSDSVAVLGDLAMSLRSISVTEDVPNIETAAESAIERLAKEHKEGVDLKYGISELDEILGGIKRGKLTTIGGKTSHGKTTVCCNIIWNNLINNDKCRILYSGFENIEDIPIKLAAMDSGLPLDWFVKPHLIDDDKMDKTVLALCKLQQYKDRLLICNGASPAQMRQICRDKRPDIVMLDYVQRCAEKFGSADDQQRRFNVSKITSDLQDIALEFNAAVFNLSQFRRLPEDRKFREPDIGDLKESGDIENYSDNIILLWWPWREQMDDRKWKQEDYRFIIAKNKLGPCMSTTLARINLHTLAIKG